MMMDEAKLGRVETVYPPEYHEAVRPLLALIEWARADIATITGVDDAALTATATIDYRDRERRVQEMQDYIREVQMQMSKVMARYIPQMTVYPDPASHESAQSRQEST